MVSRGITDHDIRLRYMYTVVAIACRRYSYLPSIHDLYAAIIKPPLMLELT